MKHSGQVTPVSVIVLLSFFIVFFLVSCGESNLETPVVSNQATPTALSTTAVTVPNTATADQSTFTPVIANTPTQIPTATPTTLIPSTTATSAATAKPKATVAATPTKAGPTPTLANGGALSEVVRGKTGKKQVALTFDAGSTADSFNLVLDTLNNKGVKITFFLTGTWATQNPTLVQLLANNGMELGNHSWDHPDFTKISDDKARSEITQTADKIKALTGRDTKPLFRFPYGARDNRTTNLVNQMGYRSVFWTLDSLDSVGETKTADFLVQRVTGQTDTQLDGAIILMHIGSKPTAQALAPIIDKLKARKFSIVPISQLIK